MTKRACWNSLIAAKAASKSFSLLSWSPSGTWQFENSILKLVWVNCFMNFAATYLFPCSWWPPPVHLVKGLQEESKDQSQEGTKKAVGNHLWNEDESSLTEDARYSRQEFLRCTFQETSRSLQSFRTLIWAEQIYSSKTIKDLYTGRFWAESMRLWRQY